MKTLNFIGNKSGFRENNNSAYIENEDQFVLIDCGFTVFNEIKKNINFKKYEYINVIITHLHNDHCGSLSQLILYLWFVYGKKTTVISKCKNVRTYLEITGTPAEAYEVINNSKEIQFIETIHAKEIDSYGFLFNINNKKIMYTGDTKVIEPFLKYINNVDELYIDVSKNGGVHIKFEEVIEILRQIKKQGTDIYLMHIDDDEYIKKINNNEFYIA